MKCQSLFSGRKMENALSAEYAERMVKVNIASEKQFE